MPNSAQEIDSYQETVWALLAFHHELVWDDAEKKVLPRSSFTAHHTEMFTLKDGSVITPDIHLLVPGGLPVGEIKMSFAAKDFDKQRKAEIEDQLRRYDAALNELGDHHGVAKDEGCLVLMVHSSRVKQAARFVNGLTFDHRIGVIGYQRTDQTQTFITLDLREGEIAPASKNEKLKNDNVLIRADTLNSEYPDILFYDAEAPDLFVAEIFWTTVLPAKAGKKADKTGTLPRIVEVGAFDVAKELADGYSIRRLCKNARQSPSATQMRRVMKMFVSMKLAKHIEGDVYAVSRKEIRNIRSSFEKRLLDAEKREAENERRRLQREIKKAAKAKQVEADRAAKKAATEAARKLAAGNQLTLEGILIDSSGGTDSA